ncbi:hypothetical protein [Pseudomonas sp. Marseille-Q1929]|uniref:hypothetical protein n=1 Tax=Pseudomonas sp. Marseille-Q1929 TaxID=2730402 RepID=UPI001A8F5D7B|nr:hypothetical protein [Pseudomonas sp. Marseille-Q1929]MBO0493677.1 hypothetical protein [Pseudomonas sp. Marseille-Q1929]
MTAISGVSYNPSLASVQESNSPATSAASDPYTSTSDEGLVFLLRTNFDRFTDPKYPGSVTRESLAKIAYFSERNGAYSDDSSLARAILERDGLFEKCDGYGKHKHDGKIDQASLGAFERKENGRFTTMSDKDIARHLFDNFNDFKYVSPLSTAGRAFDELTVPRLQRVLTSNTSSDEDKMFVRELLSRPELMQQLGFDGKHGQVGRHDIEKKLPYIK